MLGKCVWMLKAPGERVGKTDGGGGGGGMGADTMWELIKGCHRQK